MNYIKKNKGNYLKIVEYIREKEKGYEKMLSNGLLIIDGSAMLSKHYYKTIPKELFKEKNSEKITELENEILHTSYGTYTNAVASMLDSILMIIKEYYPKYMIVCFNTEENTYKRNIFSDYRKNKREIPELLKEQFKLIEQVLSAIGIQIIYSDKYGAEDYAGTIAHKFEQDVDVYILARNQNYFQLATEKTTILMMQTNETKVEELEKKFKKEVYFENSFPFNIDTVKTFTGVFPSQIPDLRSITGDVSDNIPGVSGVNTAAKYLLNVYTSMEELYSDLEKMKIDPIYKNLQIKVWKQTGLKRSPYNMLIKEHSKEDAIMSKKLSTILRNIPLDLSLNDLQVNINENNLETVKNILEL